MDDITIAAFIEYQKKMKNATLTPQKPKGDSIPAVFVKEYGKSDPNALVWINYPVSSYTGFIISHEMLRHKSVFEWYKRRQYGRKTIIGDKYNAVYSR